MSMKNPLTPAGIEPATFRFVAQHLNHCATAVPQLINNLTYLFRFPMHKNTSWQNNPCKHNDNHKYAGHVFDVRKFCKSPQIGLCVSCESHNKNVLCPLRTSIGFTCNGDCVLCELKTDIFIYYLVEDGTNPLSSRIK